MSQGYLGSSFTFHDKNKEILTKLLKCDIIISSFEGATNLELAYSYGSITICYEGKKITEEDIKNMKKEAFDLEKSIERRKKLLSNEGYVNKAPEKIVNEERQKLVDEENKLKTILEKIK